MMNEAMKDNGLRKAVKQQPRFSLPSNFVYRTMLKVDRVAMLRERSRERRLFWATVAASLLLIVATVCYISICLGDIFREAFTVDAFSTVSLDTPLLPTYFLLAGIAALLLFLDHWMRKAYFNRHKPGV